MKTPPHFSFCGRSLAHTAASGVFADEAVFVGTDADAAAVAAADTAADAVVADADAVVADAAVVPESVGKYNLETQQHHQAHGD